MNKKIFILTLFVGCFFLFGCGENDKLIDFPKNVSINDNILSWDSVDEATKYRLNFVSVTNNQSNKRVSIENTVDLTSLNLQPDTYKIYIQTIGNNTESEYTETFVEYTLVDLNKVTKFEGENLINNLYIKWFGRTWYDSTLNMNTIFHSASGFEVYFFGTTVKASIYATNTVEASKRPYVVIVVDDDFEHSQRVALTNQRTELNLVDFSNDDGLKHKVALYKSTESIDSHIGVLGIETNGEFVQEINYKDHKIEVIAASSSTGYGNLGTSSQTKTTANSDSLQAFAFLAAKELNADINIYSASGWGVKASIYTKPETLNLYDAYQKVDFKKDLRWDFSSYVPDVVVVNLGTNDWSYINKASNTIEKEQRIQAFKDQYVAFLEFIHSAYPKAKIIMLYGLMNEANIYTATNEIYNTAKLSIPDLGLLYVNGDGKGCNSHPSTASHQKIANSLVAKIKEEMGW